MSFDPFAAESELPPNYGPGVPMSGDLSAYARQRVRAPAIALIVVGCLNLLATLVEIGQTVWIAITPAEEIQKMLEDRLQKLEQAGLPPNFIKAVREQQGDMETGKSRSLMQNSISSALALLIGVLSLLGGMRMLSLRSYALSVAGAISAAIPCLSCGGLCCFGEIIGIWALIVLINVEVRSSFQS